MHSANHEYATREGAQRNNTNARIFLLCRCHQHMNTSRKTHQCVDADGINSVIKVIGQVTAFPMRQ